MANFGVKSDWVYDEEELSIQPGDIIEFDRGAYIHAAIADGEGSVYHFSGEPTDKKNACIRIDDIAEVSDGDRFRINNANDNNYQPLGGSEIVEAAEKIKESQGIEGYDLFLNNCEHFASLMRYGKSTSPQVNQALGGILGYLFGGPVGLALGVFSNRP